MYAPGDAVDLGLDPQLEKLRTGSGPLALAARGGATSAAALAGAASAPASAPSSSTFTSLLRWWNMTVLQRTVGSELTHAQCAARKNQAKKMPNCSAFFFSNDSNSK